MSAVPEVLFVLEVSPAQQYSEPPCSRNNTEKTCDEAESHLDQLQLFVETSLLLVRLRLLRRLVLEEHHQLLDVIAQHLNLTREARTTPDASLMLCR